jgi:hypothetical protein
MKQDLDRLAGFHHTVSDQLNSRLEESPRFFWVLVGVSTAYGYVLWNFSSASGQAQPARQKVLVLASILVYAAVLWASWYLAALGYAFRFLQNCQHCVEHALGWDLYVPSGRRPGTPPSKVRWFFCSEVFWLLPGIYHAHAAGLVILLAMISGAFCWNSRQWWPSILFLFGVWFIIWINSHYVRKFIKMRRDPGTVPRLHADPLDLVE